MGRTKARNGLRAYQPGSSIEDFRNGVERDLFNTEFADIVTKPSTLMAGMDFPISDATKRDDLNAQWKIRMAMDSHMSNQTNKLFAKEFFQKFKHIASPGTNLIACEFQSRSTSGACRVDANTRRIH